MPTLLLLSILLPLAGVVLVWPAAALNKSALRVVALVSVIATAVLAGVVVYGYFQPWAAQTTSTPGRYAEMSVPWLGTDYGIDVRFAISLDGISLWLYALSALLMFTAVLVGWQAIDRQEPLYYAMLLLLLCGCLGVFAAQDIILFYVYFEFTLIPLFFIIGVWGSEERRYAALKFFVFTLTGSLLTFLGLLTIVFWASGYVGTAGAWNVGKAMTARGERPMSLTFDIPTLQFRLKNQYKQMLEVADSKERHDRRIDAREALNVPPERLARARDVFDDAVLFKYDANDDESLGYNELIAHRKAGDRLYLDALYLSALFNRFNDDQAADADKRLTFDEIIALTDKKTPAAAMALLESWGIDTDKVQPSTGEQAAPPWSLSIGELTEIGAAKVAETTHFRVTRADLDRFSPETLDRLAGWSFGPADLKKMDFPLQMWIYLALFVGFAIKVPLFPLHTWLPLAHVQAPTAGSVLLAGILLKIGTYGFLRFNIPLLPEATAAAMPWLLWLAVVGIIYGALVALAQSDMKKLVAYSSVSHMGFCMLGMFALNPLGLEGSVLQMVNHGISTGALFALVGMLYERYHTRQIKDLGGLAYRLPVLAFFMLLFTMSSIGLPGLNGFVGEFMILLGMFQRAWMDAPALIAGQLKVISVVAVAGVVLGAWYMLWLVQRVFFGPLREPHHGDGNDEPIRDLSLREIVALTPLAIMVVWIGLWPAPFLKPMEKPLQTSTAQARRIVEQEVASTQPANDFTESVAQIPNPKSPIPND